jgi:hypothetical protein
VDALARRWLSRRGEAVRKWSLYRCGEALWWSDRDDRCGRFANQIFGGRGC